MSRAEVYFPEDIEKLVSNARAEADAAGYARGRTDGLREAATIVRQSTKPRSLIGKWLVLELNNRARTIAPEPTPGHDLPPDILASALTDRVHTDVGRGRAVEVRRVEPTPGPLTNCDSCAHDYDGGRTRLCRLINGRPDPVAAVHRWACANTGGDDPMTDNPKPGATGCPGYAPKPAPTTPKEGE